MLWNVYICKIQIEVRQISVFLWLMGLERWSEMQVTVPLLSSSHTSLSFAWPNYPSVIWHNDLSPSLLREWGCMMRSECDTQREWEREPAKEVKMKSGVCLWRLDSPSCLSYPVSFHSAWSTGGVGEGDMHARTAPVFVHAEVVKWAELPFLLPLICYKNSPPLTLCLLLRSPLSVSASSLIWCFHLLSAYFSPTAETAAVGVREETGGKLAVPTVLECFSARTPASDAMVNKGSNCTRPHIKAVFSTSRLAVMERPWSQVWRKCRDGAEILVVSIIWNTSYHIHIYL